MMIFPILATDQFLKNYLVSRSRILDWTLPSGQMVVILCRLKFNSATSQSMRFHYVTPATFTKIIPNVDEYLQQFLLRHWLITRNRVEVEKQFRDKGVFFEMYCSSCVEHGLTWKNISMNVTWFWRLRVCCSAFGNTLIVKAELIQINLTLPVFANLTMSNTGCRFCFDRYFQNSAISAR